MLEFLTAGNVPVYDQERPYSRTTHVYVLRRHDTAQIKIGITRRSVAERKRDVENGCGVDLELLLAFRAPVETERELHAHFAEFRQRGEWFRECPQIHEWIERQREHIARQ